MLNIFHSIDSVLMIALLGYIIVVHTVDLMSIQYTNLTCVT